LKYDEWKKGEGMSRDEAQKKYLEVAIPIMRNAGFESYIELPQKKAMEEKYNRCIARLLKEGASLKELEAQRIKFEKEEERLGKLRSLQSRTVAKSKYRDQIVLALIMNCCFASCLACMCLKVKKLE